MKKILCILLALLCVLPVMAGCSASKDVDDGGKVDDVITTPVDKENNETTTPEDTETTTPEETEDEFAFGVVADNKYTSEFAGITFTAPDGWVFYTDEEIKALNNITQDVVGEDIAELLKNATIIYDMYAINNATGESANINFEKIPTGLDIADLKSALTPQIDVIKTAFTEMGATVNKVETADVTIGDKTYDAIYVDAEANGVHIYENVVAFVEGDYIAYVTVCSTSTDGLTTLLNCVTID